VGEPLFIESPEPEEDVTPDGSKPSPEGCGRPGAFLMNVVVKKVAKVGDKTACARFAVVRAEDGRNISVIVESLADPNERIWVHFDVGVDEHHYVATRVSRSLIPRGRRTEMSWALDNDQLFRRINGSVNRGNGTVESQVAIRCGDNYGQRHHVLSVGRVLIVHCSSSMATRPHAG
jgi:hypothetical protein